MAYYRKVEVPEIHSKDLLELYFTNKEVVDNIKTHSYLEGMFIAFIEAIVEYSRFNYVARHSDEVFVAWVRGKKSLVRFIRKSRLSSDERKVIKEEMDELAKELEDQYGLEATYLIHEKTKGGSELTRLNLVKRH